jgi:hypothetical protein
MIETMKSYIIKRAEYANCTGRRERAKIVQELLAQCRLVNVCMPIYYISIHTDGLGVIDNIETESGSYEWSDDMLRFVKDERRR